MQIDINAAWETVIGMVQELIAMLPQIVLGLIVFVAILFLSNLLRRLVEGAINRYRSTRSVGIVVGRVAQWIAIFVGALIALSIVIPSFEASSLIQLLGISGVAIGFAFRDIFQNFLAGILILLTEPFRIGDQIVVNDYEGTVEDIKTRATMIRTYDGRRVVIPNADLFTNSVTVNTAFDYRRSEYDVGIRYEDDIPAARRIAIAAMREVEGVLDDPAPDAILVGLADSSVTLRVRWWTRPSRSDVLIVQDRVLELVKRRLEEQGIEIPFPIRTLYFHDPLKVRDDRPLQQ